MLFFAMILSGGFVQAEWAHESEADVELSEEISRIDVNEDGSSSWVEMRKMKALNDKGRSRLALESISFNPDMTSISVKSASSTTDGVVSKVELSAIQERASQGKESGVTGNKELVIPFNNLKVGSTIEYEYITKTKKSPVTGIFTMRFLYGLQFPEKSGKTVITSARKINYAVVDPDKVLKVEPSQENGKYRLTISLVKSAFKVPKEVMPSIPKNMNAQVEISTGESWSEFATKVSEKYEQVLSVKNLPQGLKDIAAKAKDVKDPYEKIDKVTSELATVMTYSGNWTTVEKMFYPKSLEEIGKLKIGDCKDFATATTAILRNLGMEASVSLVYRHDSQRTVSQIFSKPIDDKIPLIDFFNHAIVNVKLDGKNVWVDPTNLVSNSKYVYSDISGTSALILNKDTKALSFIPESSSLESQIKSVKTLKLNPDDTVDSEGTLEVNGDYAKSIFEAAVYKSEQSAKDGVVYLYGSNPREARSFIEGLNFKARIARKVEGKIKVFGEKYVVNDSKGERSLYIPLPNRIGVYVAATKGRKSDFYVGPQAIETSITKVPGYDFSKEDFGCISLSPWYTIERKLVKTKEGFEIHDRIHYRQSLIQAADINTDEYQFNHGDIASCGQAQKIKITPIAGVDFASRTKDFNKEYVQKLVSSQGPKSIDNIIEAKNKLDTMMATNPDDKDHRLMLYRTIYRINFKRSDVKRSEYDLLAGDILNKLYREFPKDAGVLRAKTRFAMGTNDLNEAKKFFKDAYYASEKGKDIFVLGGNLANKLKDFKTAEGSYKRALEYTKDAVEIGNIFSDLADNAGHAGQTEQMMEYFKKALEYNPSDAWLYSRYVEYLNYLQKWDESIVASEKMLKVADFGVGRKLLGEAYQGKATKIWKGYVTRPVQTVTDPEQDVVAELCYKALKYEEQSYTCLNLLGIFALNTAKKEQNLEKAQKAYDYFSRSLMGPGNSTVAKIKKLQTESQQVIESLQSNRAPASK